MGRGLTIAMAVWGRVLLVGAGVALAGSASAAASSSAPAAAGADLDRVMGALAQRKHGHVSFTEKKFIALLDRPVESSGELLYDAPDRLEKRTIKPKPEDLVLEGGVVSAQRGRHHYVLDLKQYPQVVPFIESIRATLAGDRASLERVFKVDFTGSFEHWTLGLVPLDSKLATTVKEIHIEGEKDLILSVEIREADGDRSLLTIGAAASPDVAQ
jgi:Outer membrane lipoprotein carrier protein LolA-like